MDATYIDLTVRLSLALILGGAIGIEREYRAKEAGFRTHHLPEECGQGLDYCCRLVGDGSHRSGVRYGNVCGCSYYYDDGVDGTGGAELSDTAVGNLYHRTEFLCSIKGQREGIHQ